METTEDLDLPDPHDPMALREIVAKTAATVLRPHSHPRKRPYG